MGARADLVRCEYCVQLEDPGVEYSWQPVTAVRREVYSVAIYVRIPEAAQMIRLRASARA